MEKKKSVAKRLIKSTETAASNCDVPDYCYEVSGSNTGHDIHYHRELSGIPQSLEAKAMTDTRTASIHLNSKCLTYITLPLHAIGVCLSQGYINFPQIYKPPPNYRRHKGDMKKVPY